MGRQDKGVVAPSIVQERSPAPEAGGPAAAKGRRARHPRAGRGQLSILGFGSHDVTESSETH